MHGLEHIIRMNSAQKRIPHPLRLHPRIWALRQQIHGMANSSEYVSRLFRSLYRYADQLIALPEDGLDALEALQQATLGDWAEELSLNLSHRSSRQGGRTSPKPAF